MVERENPYIERDGRRIELTEDECRAVYRQLERERVVGYVYDMLGMLRIEPNETMPLEAYVRAYSVESADFEYISQDELDYFSEVFGNEDKMARYAEQADPQDGYMFWRDPKRDAYEG